jgi:hypothetical protein
MISHSVVEPTISDFYSSYLSWNWPGWKLARQDGRTYFFPDGGAVQRPEQGALIAVQDASGNSLRLQRDSTGICSVLVPDFGGFSLSTTHITE